MAGSKCLCLVLMTISLLQSGTADSNSTAYLPGTINCYQCTGGGKGSPCDVNSPGVPATHQDNCPNPNKLLKEWIGTVSSTLEKLDFKAFNLDTVATNLGKEIDSGANLTDVPGCVFFYASSKNVFTSGVDSVIQKAREIFGDSNAGDSVAVAEYVKRDCVTIRTRAEVKSQADRCITIPGTKDIFTLLLCTCTSDKCNEGMKEPHLKGLIASAVGDGNNTAPVSNQYDKFLISTTLLSAYAIHQLY